MELFDKLTPDKQLLIINAAYACFGKNGYKKTSMADIAEAAGISKASLFHYFGTKKNLYLFLYRYGVDEIVTQSPEGSEDFFECIRIVSAVKMEVLAKYPGMFDFMSSTVEENAPEITEELKRLAAKSVEHGMSVIFSKVDWNRFRPEVDRKIAFNAITWISEGYLHSALGHKDGNAMRNELAGYMDLLKKALYRDEYVS